jgi:PAS domain S-box-containing protein
MSSDLPRELLQALLDRVPLRLAVLDAEQRFRYANPAALAQLGCSAEQLIGRRLIEVRGPQVAAFAQASFARVLAGEAQRRSSWLPYPGLGFRFTEEWELPFQAGDGERFVLACAHDLTEHQQRVDQAQRAEALKSSIVDNALAALVSSDPQGRIVAFNPAAERLFGCPSAEALGRTVAELMVPERLREAHAAGMARLAAGEAPRMTGRRLEMQALRADGSEFPIEMVLWRTDVGGESFFTASINDLSERRRAQATIEQQREALRQGEKLSAMGGLLAGVAHELNNPLAIVMGRASLLQETCREPALAADLQRIHDAAERCGRIVRTFLNMARSRPVQRAPVVLNELIHAALELLSYGLRSHGVQVDLALSPDLPSAQADADQLGQILLNLIVNAQQALAHTPAPRCLRISSGVEPARDGQGARQPRVWVRVHDNGPGVPAPLRDSVFEPFFTTKPESLGTGLGLAVSRSLAREHGGELRLEVLDGPGACFRLSLPISAEAPIEPAASAPAPLDGRGTRLLVVDDEAEITELMRAMLEAAGHEVATAGSGQEALALLETAHFDAVISDLRMADLDGAGLHRVLRQRHPQLARRLLIVSGDTLSPASRAFLEEARCAWLDKPFSKADLLQHVQALLAP